MRALLLSVASVAGLASYAAAGAANATSIENFVTGQDDNGSVSSLSCAHCPPLVVVKRNTYVVPQVAPGTSRVELKDINGEMKLLRTESWSGGSPVVFISKASEEDIKAAEIAKANTGSSPAAALATAAAMDVVPTQAKATTTIAIIDTAAKTGSLDMASMSALTPKDTASQEVDLKNFELRLK